MLLVVVVGVAYAYDSSQKDEIADGVTIGGVDVGGMTAEDAKCTASWSPAEDPLEVSYEGQTWTLRGEQLKIHADVSRRGRTGRRGEPGRGLPGRLVRYVSGGEVDETSSPRSPTPQPAINRFVRHVAEEINREPKNAAVSTAPRLEVVAGENGRKLRDNLLESDLKAAVPKPPRRARSSPASTRSRRK